MENIQKTKSTFQKRINSLKEKCIDLQKVNVNRKKTNNTI